MAEGPPLDDRPVESSGLGAFSFVDGTGLGVDRAWAWDRVGAGPAYRRNSAT